MAPIVFLPCWGSEWMGREVRLGNPRDPGGKFLGASARTRRAGKFVEGAVGGGLRVLGGRPTMNGPEGKISSECSAA